MTAVAIEAGAAIVILYGACEALMAAIRVVVTGRAHTRGQRRQLWLCFGMWLLLGLEFELAADIVRSAISPTWTGIGQLGAIAVIRTFLNYFLEKDLEHYEPVAVDTQRVAGAMSAS